MRYVLLLPVQPSDKQGLIEYTALVNKAFIDAGLLVNEHRPLKVFLMFIVHCSCIDISLEATLYSSQHDPPKAAVKDPSSSAVLVFCSTGIGSIPDRCSA